MNYSVEDILNEFKNRIRLSDFLAKYVNVEKKGNSYVCRCPFHNEKTPSFSINNEKGLFYCFGCGIGGNVLTFLTKYNNVSFSEALSDVANLLGVQLKKKVENIGDKKTERFFKFTKLLNSYFKRNIIDRKDVIDYLHKRGIDNLSISKFELGFCGDNNTHLERILTENGFNRLDQINYGIIIETKNKNFFHRFQNRITFPIYDFTDNIVGFGGRTTNNSKIKYINSPESFFFKKSNNLYGFKQNKNEIKKLSELIVVEGYMDVISLHSKKVFNSVASLGTSLSENQIKKLWQLVECPLICFDGDNPGKNAMKKVALKALKYLETGKSLKFIELPQNEDPDNFIQKNEMSKFREKLRYSKNLCELVWENLIEEDDNYTPEYSVLIDQRINELTKSISNTKIAFEYTKYLRERKNDYFWEKRKQSISSKKKYTKTNENQVLIKNLNEMIIISFLIFEFDISRQHFEQVNMIRFQNEKYEILKKRITAIYIENELDEKITMEKVMCQLNSNDIDLSKKLRKTHFIHLDNEKKIKFFNSVLDTLKLPILKDERDLLKRKIIENKTSNISEEFLRKYENINQEINYILGKEID